MICLARRSAATAHSTCPYVRMARESCKAGQRGVKPERKACMEECQQVEGLADSRGTTNRARQRNASSPAPWCARPQPPSALDGLLCFPTSRLRRHGSAHDTSRPSPAGDGHLPRPHLADRGGASRDATCHRGSAEGRSPGLRGGTARQHATNRRPRSSTRWASSRASARSSADSAACSSSCRASSAPRRCSTT